MEVVVKILSIGLFAFSLLFSISAQEEEPRNVGAVRAVKNKLFARNLAGRGGRGGRFYFSIDFASKQFEKGLIGNFSEGLVGNVVVVDDDNMHESTVAIGNRGIFGDLDFGFGYQQELSRRVNIRLEGGLRWMRFEFDNPTYSHVDFAPVSIDQINELAGLQGTADARGFRGGVFLDFEYSGHSENFLYLGSSYGLIDVKAQIDSFRPSFNDGDNTDFITAEAGINLGGCRFGYEFTRFGEVNLMAAGGSSLTVASGNRHMLKFGIINFFRRR